MPRDPLPDADFVGPATVAAGTNAAGFVDDASRAVASRSQLSAPLLPRGVVGDRELFQLATPAWLLLGVTSTPDVEPVDAPRGDAEPDAAVSCEPYNDGDFAPVGVVVTDKPAGTLAVLANERCCADITNRFRNER